MQSMLSIDEPASAEIPAPMKTLKSADAKRFVESPDDVDLWEFETIDTDAAATMAAAELDDLNLSGVTKLSVEAARALAKFPGIIRLSSLIEMPVEVLREFKNHTGGMWLSFESADRQLMEALPEKGMIDFTRLRELSGEAASALQGREGDLTFGGINDLSAEVAAFLATISGDLDLSYVRTADAAALKALAPHLGTLRLGLVYLNKDHALALSAHEGSVVLSDLRLVMPEVAEALAKFPHDLSLSGALAPGPAEKLLREHSSFDEDWICNEVLDEYSAGLVDDSGNGPDFSSIRLLGSGAVQKLIEKRKDDEYPNMSLSNFLAISDDDAEALKSFRGMIELGVYGLSDSAAASLAKHRGSLHLGYLADISEAGANALSKHKGLSVNERYLPSRIYAILTNAENAGEDTEDSDAENEATQGAEEATNSMHLTLGRLRARFDGNASMMGGFGDLLDDLEKAIADGADVGFLKLERLLIEFLETAKRGESTEGVRKKFEDGYWESGD
jgi:hypothetical protein